MLRLLKLLTKHSFKAAFCGFLFMIGCATNSTILPFPESNLQTFEEISLKGKDIISASAYLDKMILAKKESLVGFNLYGNLPDGCSKLNFTFTLDADTLSIVALSKKNKRDLCLMRLQPFSVFVPFQFFGLSSENLKSLKFIRINQLNTKVSL